MVSIPNEKSKADFLMNFHFFVETEFEYLLGQCEAVRTDIKEDPRPQVKDKLFADLADNNDW